MSMANDEKGALARARIIPFREQGRGTDLPEESPPFFSARRLEELPPFPSLSDNNDAIKKAEEIQKWRALLDRAERFRL